jgi:hypothetical protein
MQKNKRLWDLYRFPGFSPEHTLSGIFGDPRVRVMGLIRRGKKLFVVPVADSIMPFTTGRSAWFATCPVGRCVFIWKWRFAESLVEGAGK